MQNPRRDENLSPSLSLKRFMFLFCFLSNRDEGRILQFFIEKMCIPIDVIQERDEKMYPGRSRQFGRETIPSSTLLR